MNKKILVIAALFGLSLATYAQEPKKKDRKEEEKNKELIDIENDKQIVYDNFNRWSIELSTGQAKGIRPYSRGYSSGNPERVFGNFQVNTFGLGVRYMIGPKFGVRFDAAYDNINDNNNPKSLPFELEQYRFGFQGVVNAVRLFNVEKEAGRFGLLLHAGIQVSFMTSRTPNTTQFNSFGRTEQNGGLIVGFSPQFRISKNFAVTSDISTLNNYRQHFNWNGAPSDRENNLSGQMVTMTLGLSYSFGSQKIHGDWAIIQDKNEKELKALESKLDDIETKLIDTDKDGVADLYDLEKNTLNGVEVNTKGVAVDQNKNSIPDSLEKHFTQLQDDVLVIVDKKIDDKTKDLDKNTVVQLINEGYVAAYFDVSKSTPTPASSDNVGFILNYLRTNPTATVEIVGAADEIGNNKVNLKLSKARAEAVKTILINAGISASRISTSAIGEDNSVNPKSDYAKRLVRKVVFKVK
jgi:OmpA-OmpF porin, OOP family